MGQSTPVEPAEGESRLHLPKVRATLPWFDPLSPHTSGSEAHVKVHIAHLELERQE